MKKYFLCILMLSVIMLWTYNSEAARPFATDDAGTVEYKMSEVEMGYTWGDEEGILEFDYVYGLTERMDIGISFGYTIETESKNSFTPAELSLKFAIVPDICSASFAYEFGESIYDINLICTKVFGQVEVDANLGYLVNEDDENLVTYAVALIWAIDEKFAIGTELLGDETGVQNLLVGMRYHIKEGLSVDAGFSKGVGDDVNNTITVGLHFEF
ncbi:hypothetical protein M0P98_08300 [bacterium]|nr:hypothetical protein [bacterium]